MANNISWYSTSNKTQKGKLDTFPVYFSDACWTKLHLYPSEPLQLIEQNSGTVYAHITDNVALHTAGVPSKSVKDVWEIYSSTTSLGAAHTDKPTLVYKVDPHATYTGNSNPQRYQVGLSFDRWYRFLNDDDDKPSYHWQDWQGLAWNTATSLENWEGEIRPERIYNSEIKDREVAEWIDKLLTKTKGRPFYGNSGIIVEPGKPVEERYRSRLESIDSESSDWSLDGPARHRSSHHPSNPPNNTPQNTPSNLEQDCCINKEFRHTKDTCIYQGLLTTTVGRLLEKLDKESKYLETNNNIHSSGWDYFDSDHIPLYTRQWLNHKLFVNHTSKKFEKTEIGKILDWLDSNEEGSTKGSEESEKSPVSKTSSDWGFNIFNQSNSPPTAKFTLLKPVPRNQVRFQPGNSKAR